MKTIIAGSRGVTDYAVVCAAIEAGQRQWYKPITEVLSGTARGVDQLGERWAEENKVPCQKFSAEWDAYGKSAGYRRNLQMLEVAQAVIACWDGFSRGTRHLIDEAHLRGLPVFVYRV